MSMGVIGKVCLVRNTMSSMGPGSRPGAPTDFSWFYQKGAGGMSSLGGYGLIKMTGVLGPVKSLSAMACISMPERTIRSGPTKGKRITADVPDNNVMLFDFGDGTLGTMDTGYVMMNTEAPSMELFGTEGVLSTWGGGQITKIRLYKDDWETDVSGWQDVYIPGLDSAWTEHASTLLSLADAVLDGKPLPNGLEQTVHMIEILEKTWVAAESRKTVDMSTTFQPPSWESIPLEADSQEMIQNSLKIRTLDKPDGCDMIR